MKARYFNAAILGAVLLATLTVSAYGNVYNLHYCQALPISAELPKVILQSGTAGSSTIYMNNTGSKVSVVAPRNWWNVNYSYCRQITIVNNVASSLDLGYSVRLTLNTTSLVSSGKMLSNGNDLRVIHWNSSSWVELDRDTIDMNTGSTQVWFKTRVTIPANGSDSNYYIYYGNPSAGEPPANRSNVYDFWDDFDDASLNPAWTFSQIGGASGSYSESGTVVILNATSSGDLWGTSDNFLFLSISRSYDVLVESYTSGWGGSHDTWSKMGGVQLRQSLGATSKNRIMSPVYSAVGATNSYRLSTAGNTFEQTTSMQPRYCRLNRIGGTSRAWYSTNGVSWTELGSQISFSSGLSDPVYLGIHLAGLSSSIHWVEIDWFKVRRYVNPEPSTYTGPEENSNWLDGWENRVTITIDNNDVDSVLSDFPVLVYLSNSSGRNNEDVSFIFDELQSYANRKKIAVTASDGTTQCYVEIESWNQANEQAFLWVKIPNINSAADTLLYLYYDSTHADNAIYVGDVGSTPAKAVWNSNFVAVWHLGELTGGTDAIKDSTSTTNDGTDSGSPSLGATGKIGNAINFDGNNDCIIVPDNVSLRLDSGLAIEAWINVDVWGNWKDIVFKGGGNAYDSDYQFALVSSGLAWDGTYNGNWRTKYFATSQDTGMWIYTVVTHDTFTVKCYRNGSEISSQSDQGAIYESTYQLGISREGAATAGYLDGIIDEVRISNTTRSAAWIRASYESERDDLLDFGSEESADYDYVLKIINQAIDNWKINLKVYSNVNISRLLNAVISFHDGSTSDQIVINSGVVTQSEGPQYDLPGNATRYISINNLNANTSGTTYLYVYLKILVPSTSTYSLFIITFEIT